MSNEDTARGLITSEEVLEAFRLGKDELEVPADAMVTAEARERAASLNVRLRRLFGTRDEMPGDDEVTAGRKTAAVRVKERCDAVITGGEVIIGGRDMARADLAICDGKIAAVGRGLTGDGLLIDASGLVVAPGIIDPHVHLGLMSPFSGELKTEGGSAILGGVTSVGCFVDGEGSHLQRIADMQSEVQKQSPIDVFFHLVISSREQVQEIPAYIERGIRSFKVYMCGIPGLIEPVDDDFMLEVFSALEPYSEYVVLCVHAENRAVVDWALSGAVDSGEYDAAQWADTHPPDAEEEAVTRAAILGREFGVRTYFVHISSREGLRAAERMRRDEGDRLAFETTSPYLAAPLLHSRAKMVPPVRDRETAEALWKALVQGIVDTVGTDNVTMTREEKGLGGPSGDILPGYPALATHLPILLSEGCNRRNIDLLTIIDAVTRKPAQIFGLYPQKGSLLPGSDADCAVLDLTLERRVDPAHLGSRSDFSPVEGENIRGWPVMTMQRGVVAQVHGRPRDPACGRFLRLDDSVAREEDQ